MQSTLAKLSLCRTAALGGRKLRRQSCDHQGIAYNSCGDRHCPGCRGAIPSH
ncbi:MAG: transposase zinc-binding domain-containing protein [Planctomycetes bacterium]|nr:transposase zinc-binding domain-containing protein [Planctomycetota bacterium]